VTGAWKEVSGVHVNFDFKEIIIKNYSSLFCISEAGLKKPDAMIGQSGVITCDVSSSPGAADRIMTLTDMAVTACQL
jgi:hypothetical protein